MNWKFLTPRHDVVVREVNGLTESVLVSAPEIQEYLAAGGVIAQEEQQEDDDHSA